MYNSSSSLNFVRYCVYFKWFVQFVYSISWYMCVCFAVYICCNYLKCHELVVCAKCFQEWQVETNQTYNLKKSNRKDRGSQEELIYTVWGEGGLSCFVCVVSKSKVNVFILAVYVGSVGGGYSYKRKWLLVNYTSWKKSSNLVMLEMESTHRHGQPR